MKKLFALFFFWANTCLAQQIVPVLIYHRVDDTRALSPTVISRDRFVEHIDMIRSMGYNTVTIKELVDFMQGKATLPENSIAITFDDGWKDQLIAADELEKRKMAATFYVLSGAFHDSRYMSKEDVIGLSINPLFELGSHSHTHMTEYEGGAKLDTRILIGEMMMSRAILENLIGKPVKNYAWPYGAHTTESVQMAERLGFTSTSMVNSTSNNSVGMSPMEIRRLNIDGNCSADHLKIMVKSATIMECK